MQYAVALQLLQNLAPALCHVAQSEVGVGIQHVECIPILLVEGDSDQQSHLHAGM